MEQYFTTKFDTERDPSGHLRLTDAQIRDDVFSAPFQDLYDVAVLGEPFQSHAGEGNRRGGIDILGQLDDNTNGGSNKLPFPFGPE